MTAQPLSATHSDGDLVRRCQGGDRESFRQLYRRHQYKVRSTLYQLCGPSELDDRVQEVFLRAWKGLPRLKQPDTFATWLYRICWNVATDGRRALARWRDRDRQLRSVTEISSGDRATQDLHYRDLVQRGLARLSIELRSVVVLHDLEDLPQKQVAEILDIPVGTVKSRLFKARSTLRQFFETEGVQL